MPVRATPRTAEVFPYAHKHAGFSFTAISGHHRLTERGRAANPTTVELDRPPSWAGVMSPEPENGPNFRYLQLQLLPRTRTCACEHVSRQRLPPRAAATAR